MLLLPILVVPLAVAAPADALHVANPSQFTLANGLTVILDENHRSPLVTVSLVYRAGVMNSEPGKSGLPHLFEHLAFQGSRHIPKETQDTAVFTSGGDDDDASTYLDRTTFHSTAPSNQLEMLLWLHSDRMGFLDGAISAERFANQLDVVLNERRQRVEDDPYGRARFVTQQLLFTDGHPVHAGGFGAVADIQSLTLDDVHRFLESYYKPANASLVLSGDFEPARARQLIEKYFGSLRSTRRTPFKPPLQAPPPQPLRETLTLDVKVPQVRMSWIVMPPFAPDAADLDLAVSILGASKSGRLYRRLVDADKLARDVDCTLEPYLVGGALTCAVDLVAGGSVDEVGKASDEVLAAFREHGPTAEELAGAKAMWRSELYHRVETTKGRAELFHRYLYYTGTAAYLPRDLAEHSRATPRSVRESAHKWLDPAHRLALTILPGTPARGAEPPRSTPPRAAPATAWTDPQPWRNQRPPSGPAAVGALPEPTELRLSNGIPIYVVGNRATPLVVVRALADKSRVKRPAPGVSHAVSELLLEGTATRTAEAIARDASLLGARLTTDDDYDLASVTLDVPKQGIRAGLSLLGDVVRAAKPTTETLERVRPRLLSEARRLQGRGGVLAEELLRRTLFGATGSYGVPLEGTPASIESMSLDEMKVFRDALWRPRNVGFVVSGDITPAEARQALERAFGSWTDLGDAVAAPVEEAPPAPARRKILVVARAGAQASLAIGRVGVPRASADWVALDVLNRAFGGFYASRLNLNLRERNGYAYSARSRFTENHFPGAFVIATAVASSKTRAAVGEVLKELDAMRLAPPHGEELALAKDGVALGLAARNESNDQLAETLSRIFAFGLPLDYLERYVAAVQALGANELQRVAERAFRSDDLVIVVAGPVDTVRAQLKASGLEPFEVVAPGVTAGLAP